MHERNVNVNPTSLLTARELKRCEVLMRHAEVEAERSTCSRAQVGVVVARDYRILGTGYNGAPAGMPHCDHGGDTLFEEGLYANTGCMVAIHAEANAIAFAARHGVQIEGADLFTTLSPCLSCAQLITNSGIRRVFAAKMYRNIAGWSYLDDAGINIHLLD